MEERERTLLHELMTLAQWRILRREAESQRLRREAAAEEARMHAHHREARALMERHDAYRRGEARPAALDRGAFDGMAVLADRAAAAHVAGHASQARLDELHLRASDLSRDIARQEERANCYRHMLEDAAVEEESEPGDP